MARTGFRKAKYNLIDEETGKYKTGGAKTFEKVIDEKFAPNFNTAELYANDAIAESDYSFIDGQLDLTVADDNDTMLAELLGNTVASSTESEQITQNIADNAPYVCYGHIIPKVVNGVKKYKVEFLPKVKFKGVSSEATTRGSSVEFKTTALSAKVFALDADLGKAKAGDWEIHKTFSSETEAETYLDSLVAPTA